MPFVSVSLCLDTHLLCVCTCSHPLYAQFALALAHTSLFAFPATTVEEGSRDMLAFMHSSEGPEIVRAAAASSNARPLVLVVALFRGLGLRVYA